jgi:hypothetical protein
MVGHRHINIQDIYPIVGVGDIFSDNAIKTISFIKVKKKIKNFLENKILT